MSLSSPDPPAAPDPYATAAAQGQMNKEAIETQAKYNRINENTPYGSLTYTGTPGGTDYTRNTTYNPRQQQLFNQQEDITNSIYGLSQDQLQRLAPVLGSTIDMSQLPDPASQISGDELPPMTVGAGDSDILASQNRLTDETFNNFMNRFQPQIEQSRQRTEQMLADRGYTTDQDAYRSATRDNEQNISDTIQNAATTALDKGMQYGLQTSEFGNNARSNMLNQMLAMQQAQTGQRQGALQEQAYLRDIPINDINSLLRGASGPAQPNFTPQTPIQVPVTPIGDYINNNYAAQMAGYNAQMQQPSFLDQVMGLGGTALGGWAYGGWK